MITEKDKEFIKENLQKLEKTATDGVLPAELKQRLMERFPFDCWNCSRKIKINVRNYINEYRRNITKTQGDNKQNSNKQSVQQNR